MTAQHRSFRREWGTDVSPGVQTTVELACFYFGREQPSRGSVPAPQSLLCVWQRGGTPSTLWVPGRAPQLQPEPPLWAVGAEGAGGTQHTCAWTRVSGESASGRAAGAHAWLPRLAVWPWSDTSPSGDDAHRTGEGLTRQACAGPAGGPEVPAHLISQAVGLRTQCDVASGFDSGELPIQTARPRQ